jgi:hypothetical protein
LPRPEQDKTKLEKTKPDFGIINFEVDEEKMNDENYKDDKEAKQ